jgi:hypothetical protein
MKRERPNEHAVADVVHIFFFFSPLFELARLLLSDCAMDVGWLSFVQGA